jgi:hypothetical protein
MPHCLAVKTKIEQIMTIDAHFGFITFLSVSEDNVNSASNNLGHHLGHHKHSQFHRLSFDC